MGVINWEKTEEARKDPHIINFLKWARENGCIDEAIQFPICFGKDGGLVGVAASRPIGANEPFILVPEKLCIDDAKAKASPCGKIFLENPDVFEDIDDADYNRLVFYVTYEITKGEKSFWYPYF